MKVVSKKALQGFLITGVFMSGLSLSAGVQDNTPFQNVTASAKTTAKTASTTKAKSYNTAVKDAGTYKGVPIYASNLLEHTLAVGLLRGETTISLSNISNADPSTVAKALVYTVKQNPLILDVKRYAIYRSKSTGYVTKVVMTYYSSQSSIIKKQDRIVKEVKTVYNKNIKNQKTKQAKVDAAYNYFMSNQVYDMDALQRNQTNTQTEDSYNSYTPYNVFVSHKGVCQGYSGALTILLRMANIDAVNVTGTMKGGSHMWTRVYLSKSNIYDYDVTPAQTGALLPYSRYRLSASQIKGYNYIQDTMWASAKMLNKYVLSTPNKDYFTTNNLVFTTTSQLKDYLTKQYNKGIYVNNFKFKNGNNQTIMKTGLSAKEGTPLSKKNKVSLRYRDDVYSLTLQ